MSLSLLQNQDESMINNHSFYKVKSMLSSIIKDFVLKHTPPMVSIIFVIIFGIAYLGKEINKGFDGVREEIIYEARTPYYLDKEYYLRKQLEKISTDPGDLKTTDIELSYILCDGEFGTKYIPSLTASREATANRACSKLSELYMSRNVY